MLMLQAWLVCSMGSQASLQEWTVNAAPAITVATGKFVRKCVLFLFLPGVPCWHYYPCLYMDYPELLLTGRLVVTSHLDLNGRHLSNHVEEPAPCPPSTLTTRNPPLSGISPT